MQRLIFLKNNLNNHDLSEVSWWTSINWKYTAINLLFLMKRIFNHDVKNIYYIIA